MHPLQVVSLLSWFILLLSQLSLLLPAVPFNAYWAAVLVFALLIPARGLFSARRYTYRWVGFMTMIYFCIGVSELFSDPALRLYGFGTTIGSMLLFLSSIYFARYLSLAARRNDPAAPS